MTPFIRLSDKDHLALHSVFEGLHCFGQTGSGKSSAVLKTYLRSCLSYGFGGAFFCPKPTDAAEFMELAREMGRERDVILLGPGHPATVNILEHELQRGGVENAIHTLAAIADIAEGRSGPDGGDSFWPRSAAQMNRAALALQSIAGESLSLTGLIRFVADLPRDYKQMGEQEWRKNSYAYQTSMKARAAAKNEMQTQSFDVAETYAAVAFPGFGDRTQGAIIATLTSAIDPLLYGEPWRILSNATTVLPEQAYTEGKIFVFDMDLANHGDTGRLCQNLFKYVFQRQMLRRGSHKRPVFLVCDEAHYFISPFDFRFQSVARGFLVSTFYLSQNLANYHATLGSKAVDALLGSLTTHLYCCNTDTDTNRYASERIGRRWQMKAGFSSSHNDQGHSASANASQHLEYEVEPHQFALLPITNPFGAIIYRAGLFSNGRNWLPVLFERR